MAPGFNASYGIPGNSVTYAFADLQVAMWADPYLVIVGVSPNRSLRRVFNPTLNFAAANSHSG